MLIRKFNPALTILLATVVIAPMILSHAEGQSTTNQSSADQSNDPVAYQKDFEKWKASLISSRKKNWIPLVGLFWLKEGANRFGSDESNQVALPKGSTPAQAGVFTLQGDKVTVELASGVAATIDGKRVEGGKPESPAQLQSDATGKPTILQVGTIQMHVIQRGKRIGIRAKDLNSEAAKAYQGPIFYPVDMSYRVVAKLQPSNGKLMVDVPDVLGDITPVPSAGVAVFTIHGHEYRLTDLGGDANGLSFVFNDLTKKTDTYPGGRFLDTGPVVNGTVVIDFNRAYNPPCSVTPYATCPLTPPENRLDVAIPAGEKYDRVHSYAHHD